MVVLGDVRRLPPHRGAWGQLPFEVPGSLGGGGGTSFPFIFPALTYSFRTPPTPTSDDGRSHNSSAPVGRAGAHFQHFFLFAFPSISVSYRYANLPLRLAAVYDAVCVRLRCIVMRAMAVSTLVLS